MVLVTLNGRRKWRKFACSKSVASLPSKKAHVLNYDMLWEVSKQLYGRMKCQMSMWCQRMDLTKKNEKLREKNMHIWKRKAERPKRRAHSEAHHVVTPFWNNCAILVAGASWFSIHIHQFFVTQSPSRNSCAFATNQIQTRRHTHAPNKGLSLRCIGSSVSVQYHNFGRSLLSRSIQPFIYKFNMLYIEIYVCWCIGYFFIILRSIRSLLLFPFQQLPDLVALLSISSKWRL